MANREGWLTLCGNVPVRPEVGSAVDSDQLPEYLLYTELTGHVGSYGQVRNVSVIEYGWIEEDFKRLDRVNLSKLSGLNLHASKPNARRQDRLEETSAASPTEPAISREDKIAAAKAKYLERKKKK